MYMGVGFVWFACLFLQLNIQSAATGCGVCPPGRDGVNGRDGHPGRDGMPGRDGTPGICLGQTEQDKQIKQLRQEVSRGNAICTAACCLKCPLHAGERTKSSLTCRLVLECVNRAATWHLATACPNHHLLTSILRLVRQASRCLTVLPLAYSPEVSDSRPSGSSQDLRWAWSTALHRLAGTGCWANVSGSWACNTVICIKYTEFVSEMITPILTYIQ